LLDIEANITCREPNEKIYEFIGVFKLDDNSIKEGLSINNTMWADTVLASKIAYGMAIYTGKETRMSLSKKKPS